MMGAEGKASPSLPFPPPPLSYAGSDSGGGCWSHGRVLLPLFGLTAEMFYVNVRSVSLPAPPSVEAPLFCCSFGRRAAIVVAAVRLLIGLYRCFFAKKEVTNTDK